MRAEWAEVKVTRSPTEIHQKMVLAHEVVLLREIHGAENVVVLGPGVEYFMNEKRKLSTKPLPPKEVTPDDEFGRLQSLYGNSGEERDGPPLVEVCHGRRGSGGLARAIRGGLNAIPAVEEYETEELAEPDEVSADSESETVESTDETSPGVPEPVALDDAAAFKNRGAIVVAIKERDENAPVDAEQGRKFLEGYYVAQTNVLAGGFDLPDEAGMDDLLAMLPEDTQAAITDHMGA